MRERLFAAPNLAAMAVQERLFFLARRFVAGETIETAPKQVEIGAGSRVHTRRAAEPLPNLLEPGSE